VETLEFSDLLRLIDERSAAFRTAVAAASSLDAQVPTCPEWTLFDLVQHLGVGRRKWAAIIAAGPADAPPDKSEWENGPAAPREREALLAWSAESTQALLDALRLAGPDRGCWTWWADSQSPPTSGAAARHQVQEIAVHTYDAQLTVGAPQPIPDEVALDGVAEYLFTCGATTSSWPHEPATVDFQATEGRSWRYALSADGARTTRLTTAEDPAQASGPSEGSDASAEAAASDLVLAFYDRIPIDSLRLQGDRTQFALIWAWDPDD
jgi:uncharacterized protein (TIGR03083 family)